MAIARVFVWGIAGMLVLGELGLNLAPLVAGAGIVGVALGFGAQKIVGDFLSGMFMIAEDQFGVGDIIDLGEASGTVERITLRTTVLRDIYGTVWHVPNGEVQRVGNMSQEVVQGTPRRACRLRHRHRCRRRGAARHCQRDVTRSAVGRLVPRRPRVARSGDARRRRGDDPDIGSHTSCRAVQGPTGAEPPLQTGAGCRWHRDPLPATNDMGAP
ncbi:MAG: mechanosensitive ion channel family protein [Microthrixaceae bacterium]|nr:mechanosensitive ion channel family protein [Microthrixaceae bacterium]